MSAQQFGGLKVAAGGLFAVLALLSLWPYTAWFVVWLLPIPLIVFFVLDSKWIPALLSCLTAVVLALGGFSWASILFGVAVYFLGWVMGESIRQSESPFTPLITGTLVMIMLELVLLAFLHWMGFDINAELAKSITESVDKTKTLLGGDASVLSGLTDDIIQRVKIVLPATLCIIGFLLSTVNLIGARLLLRRSPQEFKPLLSTFRLPYSAVAVYMIALSFVLFGWLKTYPVWWQVLNSLSLLTGFFIGIQGLAYIWRRIRNHSLRYLWLTLLIGVVPLLPIAGNIYILFGLLDSMNNARRTR